MWSVNSSDIGKPDIRTKLSRTRVCRVAKAQVVVRKWGEGHSGRSVVHSTAASYKPNVW